jgi:PAS domain S-box-containing protein
LSSSTTDNPEGSYAELRESAKKALAERSAVQHGNLKDPELLYQELQIHQIELELQNDELRSANEELEIEQLKFRSIYDLAPIGYFILDHSGTIEQVNYKGAEIFEIPKNKLQGRKLGAYIIDEHLMAYHNFIAQVFSGTEKKSCQLNFRPKQGKAFYAHVEGVSIRNKDAVPQCYLAVIDITDRILASNRLSEVKERLELALEGALAGAWEFDIATTQFSLDGYSLRLFNLNEGQFDKKYLTFLQLLHQEDRDLLDNQFRNAINKGMPIEVTCRFITSEHKMNFIDIRGRIVNRTGGGNRIIGMLTDVTEKKNMEMQSAVLKADQQKNITLATLNAEDKERKRISEALHDSLGQLLYGIKIQLADLKNAPDNQAFTEIDKLLNAAIKETRNMAFEIAPSVLNDFGLCDTIRNLAQRLSTAKLQIKTSFAGMSDRLDFLMETNIFRIVQELINNALKHATPTLISVFIKKTEEQLLLIVDNNGADYNPKPQDEPVHGTGLSSIRNRLSLYDGTIEIQAEPGKGTRVVVVAKL